MAYIELKDITYRYPLAEETCLRDINISIERGKFYAILGKNGSGKTSLCNIIRGFIPSFYNGELTGQVIFNGMALGDYDKGELAEKIGYVFENPFNQITGARETVFEEIAYGLENFAVPRDEMIERVEKVMELTNIVSLKDKNPFELSGGQQQRVAFASILVLNPDVYVIDEPTSQLDPRESERVYEIILKLKEMGKTIILVEHDIELIAQYSDEIIVLNEGNLIVQGSKSQVLSDTSLLDLGISIPKSVIINEALAERGLKLRKDIITREQLIEELNKYMGGRYGDN